MPERMRPTMNESENRSIRRKNAGDFPRRGFLALLATFFAGCSEAWVFTKRGKTSSEMDDETFGMQLVGDVARIWGKDPQKVAAICLVSSLRGTGGEPTAGSDRRKMLIDMMKKNKVENITGVLASRNVADAVVEGFIPPAAQVGDRFDVVVMTPKGSDTSSLRHGWLLNTPLKQAKQFDGRIYQGHIEAMAEGPIIVEAEYDSLKDTLDPTSRARVNPREVRGKIVGGGRVRKPRMFGLVILPDKKTTIMQTSQIGASINRRFNYMDRGAKAPAAIPKEDDFIELKLDPQYRGNLDRYFRVILHVAIGETDDERAIRLRRLKTMLMEPTSAMSAALQLEAIGPRGIETLLEGLNSPDLQVRFLSAEALAYQDKHQGVSALHDAAKEESAFRWHALAALSTITHVSALDALDSLLHVVSAETRYGAFRALKKRNGASPIFGGEELGENGKFVLHTVPSNGSPLVHYTRSREPEIVLFGDAIEMRVPEFLDGGEILIKSSEDGTQIRVCRFTTGEDRIEHCAPRVKDFILALVNVGASYGVIVQILDQAKRDDLLSCRLVADATPKPGREYTREDEDSEQVVAPAPTNLMAIPDLFQTRQAVQIRTDDEDEESSGNSDSDEENWGWFDKMGSWFGLEK
jgi:hypothetical protein